MNLIGLTSAYQNGRAPAVDVLRVVFQIPQKCSNPRESVSLAKHANFLDVNFVYLCLSSTMDSPLSGGRHTITVRDKVKGSNWERRDDELGRVGGEEFPVKIGPRACSDVEF